MQPFSVPKLNPEVFPPKLVKRASEIGTKQSALLFQKANLRGALSMIESGPFELSRLKKLSAQIEDETLSILAEELSLISNKESLITEAIAWRTAELLKVSNEITEKTQARDAKLASLGLLEQIIGLRPGPDMLKLQERFRLLESVSLTTGDDDTRKKELVAILRAKLAGGINAEWLNEGLEQEQKSRAEAQRLAMLSSGKITFDLFKKESGFKGTPSDIISGVGFEGFPPACNNAAGVPVLDADKVKRWGRSVLSDTGTAEGRKRADALALKFYTENLIRFFGIDYSTLTRINPEMYR